MVVELIALQPRDQAAEFVVCVGDLSVIEMAAVLSTIRLGRIVRTVGIVQMQPEEKRTPGRFLQPFLVEPIQRMRDTLAGFAIDQANVLLLEGFGGEGVVVEIETACQSPTSVQNEGTNHCTGGITLQFKGLSDRAELRRERLSGEILHPILKGICARQNDRMGRPGQRDLRNGAFENNAIMGESIQGRRFDIGAAITSEVVGAYRVNRDDDHVRRRFPGGCSSHERRKYD